TDFPYPWTKTAVDHVLGTPGLSDEQKIAILGGTAAALLGIRGVAALAGRATGATCARSASGSRQHCKAPLTLTSERKETSALVVLVPGAESGQFPGVLFLQPEPAEPFDAGRNEGCPSNRSREVGRADCLARTVVGLAVYRPSQVQPLSR